MTQLLDWKQFALQLQHAAIAPSPSIAVGRVVRPVLVRDNLAILDRDETVITVFAHRIDAVDSSAQRSVAIASDLAGLLLGASSTDAALELMEIVAERERVAQVVSRYLAEKLTRASLLSFITEQKWPAGIRRSVRELDDAALGMLSKALRSPDVASLERLLVVPSRGPRPPGQSA